MLKWRVVSRPSEEHADVALKGKRMDRLEKNSAAEVDAFRAEIRLIREMTIQQRIENRKFRAELRERRKKLNCKFRALKRSHWRTIAAMRKTDQKCERLIAFLNRRSRAN